MENRTEFNLVENVKKWTLVLTKKNNLTKTNVVELENHLYDSIEDLKSRGLNEEEAFIIAKKRIGKIDDIWLEFEKVNTGFSFFNKIVPYLKGALVCIAFMVLSKLFLVVTLLLSQWLGVNEIMFVVISLTLLVIIPILLFSKLFYNFKHGKPFLRKLTNINILVVFIIMASFINTRLISQVVLPGININTSEVVDFYTMEMSFAIYKMFSGLVLLIASLIFFWKHKKQNKMKLVD
jgi:hypothetical protein